MRLARHIGCFLCVWLLALVPACGSGRACESTAPRRVTTYARFQAGPVIAYGLVEGDQVRRIDGDLFGKWRATNTTYPLDEVNLLVPTTPSKILAMAGNYRTHLHDAPPPGKPELFFKPPSCLLPDGGTIILPPGAGPVDYEAEMVIVIGKQARNVSKHVALDYVLGVTCGNDVSARDWQKNDRQWWRAKGCDTFGPCGPFIVSGINYDDLLLQSRLNGQIKQKQRTRDLIYGVADIVSFASKHVTLDPGDLIFTGTPGTTSPLQPGDVVQIELEAVGVLRNTVQAGSDR